MLRRTLATYKQSCATSAQCQCELWTAGSVRWARACLSQAAAAKRSTRAGKRRTWVVATDTAHNKTAVCVSEEEAATWESTDLRIVSISVRRSKLDWLNWVARATLKRARARNFQSPEEQQLRAHTHTQLRSTGKADVAHTVYYCSAAKSSLCAHLTRVESRDQKTQRFESNNFRLCASFAVQIGICASIGNEKVASSLCFDTKRNVAQPKAI